MSSEDVTRFRSFAERYVVSRSHLFEVGKEKEHGWMAVEDARVLYEQIDQVARRRYGAVPDAPLGTPGPAGATGASMYHKYPSNARLTAAHKALLQKLQGKNTP